MYSSGDIININCGCQQKIVVTRHVLFDYLEKKNLNHFVLSCHVTHGNAVKLQLFTKQFVLTASPLSPLLPFWPGPPVSPCGCKCKHMND